MTEDPGLGEAWRAHWAGLVASLVRSYRDLAVAEEAAAEAFAAAAKAWPVDGVPDSPGAWLYVAARHRADDQLRRRRVATRKAPLLLVDDDEGRPDDRLRLVFTCCHPALSPAARVALTLRYVVGIPTVDIARLFMVAEQTMAARLTRARRKLTDSGIGYRVPDPDELPHRLEAVTTVVYVAFTSGYAPRSGADVVRVDASDEAIRLGRMLHRLMPGEPEVTALLALMLLQHARRDARRDANGDMVLLPDQDRSRWHRDEINEAVWLLRALARDGVTHGRYFLEACIAAEHGAATVAAGTNWRRIARLYARLEELTGSAVVRLNRAVAVAEANGPVQGLRLLEGLDERLPNFHMVAAARADFLRRLDRPVEAARWYRQAAQTADTAAQRRFLEGRLTELGVAAGESFNPDRDG